MDPISRAAYLLLDRVRRAQGEALAALGFGPAERPYTEAAAGLG
jgi:hypothetical protein